MVYDEDRQLKVQPHRPAFGVVFRYHEQERSLEINAKGGKQRRGDLQKVFSRIILGADIPEQSDEPVVYELNGLLSPDHELVTDPADGIKSARLTLLKLRVLGRVQRTVTLQAGPGGGSELIYELLEDILAGRKIRKELLTVQQVGIQLTFLNDGGPRKRTLSFKVSHPNSCSLRNDKNHELAKEYLKRWRLDRSGHSDYSASEHRGDGQYLLWKA
jgi:hypothetical protein